MPVDNGTAKFDLTLVLTEEEGGLGGAAPQRRPFAAATAERWLDHYARLLAAAVADPALPLSQLPLLDAAGSAQIVAEWNDTRVEYPEDATLHGLVAAQAARTPDSPAVTFEGASLTYRELTGRADRLARHLRGLGVGPDVLVGLCAERSLEMMVGLLAVLKAGGAYVPLDPGYPAERLAFMLADSAVPVLLTQERLAAGLPAHGAITVTLERVGRGRSASLRSAARTTSPT